MPPDLPPDFGNRVRAAVAYTGLSLSAFAKRIPTAGASYSTLRKYIKGERVPRPFARAALVTALARASGLDEGFFYGTLPDRDGIATELAAIRTLLETLRVESTRNAQEVIRRLDEGRDTGEGAR